MRIIARFVVTGAAAVLFIAPQAGLSSAASASRASAAARASASLTRYVMADAVCGQPGAGRAACLAVRRLTVKATTPGAHAVIAHPEYATGPAGGYTPGDLATAYGVNANAATSVTVGIVDAYHDPNALADLRTFDSYYGLPAETATSFKQVSQTGSAALPAANAGWAAEISLDLQAVRGLCHTCKILLVEANSSTFADLGAAENEAVALGAKVVSNSYGGAENGPIPSSIRSAYNHPGVVITASTGDDGLFDWDRLNAYGSSSSAPELPSSLDTVVAVGGTTLYLNPNGTRSAETVWNENGSADATGASMARSMGATGGGCSTQEIGWGWQTSVPGYAQTGCGNMRLAADIAALADPFTGYDIVDTYGAPGWQTFGGTSLAAPLVAAMWALAGGSGGMAYPSASLYAHFKSDPTNPLYDVTAGGNGLCDGVLASACKNFIGGWPNTFGRGTLDCAWAANSTWLVDGTRECDAATGYDGPSGVGTPIGLNAFKAMAPTAKLTVAASIAHRVSTTLSAAASADPFPGGAAVRYDWTFGDGTTARTTTPTVAHTFAVAGPRSVTLKITDSYFFVGSVTVPVTVR